MLSMATVINKRQLDNAEHLSSSPLDQSELPNILSSRRVNDLASFSENSNLLQYLAESHHVSNFPLKAFFCASVKSRPSHRFETNATKPTKPNKTVKISAGVLIA